MAAVAAAIGVTFGPHQLDLRTKTLRRGDATIVLPARQIDLLAVLVSHPGRLLSKDELIKAAWGDVVVSDNSLAQAVSHLRAALDADDHERYIRTARGHGYRFVAPVAPIEADVADAELDAMLDSHRLFLDGRAALETLARAEIAAARTTFDRLVRHHPHDVRFHVGLATALTFWFDSTRADPTPDMDALRLAVTHAREACRLSPAHAEAWATLGFALARTGITADALAAHARSVALEPDNWRHLIRLAFAAWGEERLVAAHLALRYMPGLAMARWVAATVYVARGALDQAEREVDLGLASMASDPEPTARFSTIGLHWLKGLLLLARGCEAEALEAFDRELALEPRGHLYGREMAAHTWAAIGAVALGRGDRAAARAAFTEALSRVPAHAMARVGLAMANSGGAEAVPSTEMMSFDEAAAQTALLVAGGDAAGAAGTVLRALAAAPPGATGWRLPLEPLLYVSRNPDTWAPVLALLRQRAM